LAVVKQRLATFKVKDDSMHDKRYPTQDCVFVVIDLRSRRLAYNGSSIFEAAEASEPGTCFGYGLDEKIAHRMACRIAERCARNEKELATNGKPGC
jgi:hypothetical protein